MALHACFHQKGVRSVSAKGTHGVIAIPAISMTWQTCPTNSSAGTATLVPEDAVQS